MTKLFADGISITSHPSNSRIQQVTIPTKVVAAFVARVKKIENGYKLPDAFYHTPFSRFAMSSELKEVCSTPIYHLLEGILKSWDTGAFTIYLPEEFSVADKLKLCTAIAYGIGIPRTDTQHSHLAKFVVTDSRQNEAPLLNPYSVLPFHTGGTFYPGSTDWLMFLKANCQNVEGDDSLLLHIADWRDADYFYRHSMNRHEFLFKEPQAADPRRSDLGNRGDMGELSKPMLFEQDGHRAIRFTFQEI
jgi:protein CsiD